MSDQHEEFSLSHLLAQRAIYLAEAKERLSEKDYKFTEMITLAAILVTDESVANVSRHLEIGYDEVWLEKQEQVGKKNSGDPADDYPPNEWIP